jgi:hypothetical protein
MIGPHLTVLSVVKCFTSLVCYYRRVRPVGGFPAGPDAGGEGAGQGGHLPLDRFLQAGQRWCLSLQVQYMFTAIAEGHTYVLSP